MGRLISTLLLVAVLAGLGGYIYFVEMKKPETAADTKTKTFDVAADQIEAIQITLANGDKTEAERQDTTWTLVQPVEAPGDSSELSNMASSLASLDVQRVVDEKPTDLSAFGLEPPRFEIAFRAKGQTTMQRLLVGDKTPTGGDVYVKKPDESKIFLVSSLVDDTFNRSSFDLRDKTILKFDRDKIDGLELSHDGTTFRFSRKGADWTIVSPGTMRADYAAIESLITSLSATLASKFVTEEATPADLRQYGLDRPSSSATVMMGNDKVTLLLGRTDNAETYAKRAADTEVVMVAPTIVGDMAKPLTEYRRKDLFDARSFSTERVELKRGSDMFVFEKSTDKDGKETWKNGSGMTVDTAKVEDLLTRLSNLRASTFETRVDPALRTPTLEVTTRFGQAKDEHRMETVRMARSGSTVVASRPDEPGAFTIDATAFGDALTALDALK
jgi:hypothetical protein